ncbi:MAG: acetylxylan esterase [Acidobacteria bacterium]|nr:acetylxylan esterase [Acidobacteriota bacterium]
MHRVLLIAGPVVLSILAPQDLPAQSEVNQIQPILRAEILSPAAALFQIKQYIVSKVPPPPLPTTATRWTAESKRLGETLLRDVVFHGWPDQWVSAAPHFEEAGVIASGPGYRTRKLRYEILPGFYSSAILYEPENLAGKVPAILNVNGHVGPIGKAVEYKQKRCINFARRGILALNLEWLAFGELGSRENRHWFGAHLDLVGTHEVGLFYLAMRKGLDYLWEHPNVDRSRVGMTGLSGGGWQTIILSSLDERVSAAVPVAGFASTRTRVEARERGDLGDIEQCATDLFETIDYPHLVALRAPRPTLLVYNAEDDCCFRAPMARPYIYDAIRPIFALYGKEDALEWHENRDPGNHNYQLDNRLAAYRFFSRHFGLPPIENEIPVDAEIKSYEELEVGLPKDNLTILGLARKIAASNVIPPVPSDNAGSREEWLRAGQARLRKLVRLMPVEVSSAWNVMNTKDKGVETLSYIFLMADGLPVTGVLCRSMATAPRAPVTIVLHDKGRGEAASLVSDRVNRGEQVLALDLLFVGDSYKGLNPASYAQVLHGMGMRALGIQVAELHALSRWTQKHAGVGKIRLEASGMRSQAAALTAAALAPDLYSDVGVRDGIKSLAYLLEKPVEFAEAPELFCLDLFKCFDLDRIAALAVPVRVRMYAGRTESP